ncbi:uncharacterized protein [Lolium perenne]|uniref:uncharacterized protein n=1 Tax=Lolium perenne TaxID=4522 RepID=UPI0021F5857F|nr:uncharacterized protein LOC127313083 [Lolium perenne]XP_051199581.1 uncharacterized protein LOC127313083 [Lolium perenne]
MESIWQLINEWEIQLLVLLSFIIQVFLFFTGSLRRCSKNGLLRGTIWIAYLGADVVAVYALGFLSRQEDAIMENGTLRRTHPLAFFWAPFLLIHLGGQDTITSFAIEDNNLWLRHLLNLVVEVTLALYVFWKSTIWRDVELLVPGIFVFVAGIIKYGERTMALRYGNLYNSRSAGSSFFNENTPQMGLYDGYYGFICFALLWASGIRMLFARRMTDDIDSQFERPARMNALFFFDEYTTNTLDHSQLVKLLDVELGIIMYDDLYTKAPLLRKRSGIILRCISQVSAIVALVLFSITSKKQGDRYGRADIVITYILFTGSLLLEVCAMITMLASPWTWAWLEAEGYQRLASISRFLLSSKVFGLPETRLLWSGIMGQYSLLRYIGFNEQVNLSQRVMSMIRKMAGALGIGEAKNLFWLSKLLDTTSEVVDDKITEFLVEEIRHFTHGGQRQWPHLGPFLKETVTLRTDFVTTISLLHLMTEIYLSEVSASTSGDIGGDSAALANVCRKLSNYMFYLVVAHPASASLLLVAAGSPESAIEKVRENFLAVLSSSKDDTLHAASVEIRKLVELPLIERYEETLEELKNMWLRLLIYAAGKSRPEEHAAQLAKGGELITFVWLLMAHYKLGDCGSQRIDLTQARGNDPDIPPLALRAFNL